MERIIRAMFFNGSPRKNKNTADMLQSAMRGAEAAGAETELVHLYDIDFKGCKSCFACKIKNSKCNGVCAIKDDLRPVLERARQADVIVLGSPVYYSYPTGVMRAFMERLMFPVGTYMYEREKGGRWSCRSPHHPPQQGYSHGHDSHDELPRGLYAPDWLSRHPRRERQGDGGHLRLLGNVVCLQHLPVQ